MGDTIRISRADPTDEFFRYVKNSNYAYKDLIRFERARPLEHGLKTCILNLMLYTGEGERMIGFADLKLDALLHMIELQHLFVQDGYRMQGWGKKLVEEALTIFMDANPEFRYFRLECKPAEIAFYDKSGFVLVERGYDGFVVMVHKSSHPPPRKCSGVVGPS